MYSENEEKGAFGYLFVFLGYSECQQGKGCDAVPLFCSCETPPLSSSLPPTREGHGAVGLTPEEATKML